MKIKYVALGLDTAHIFLNLSVSSLNGGEADFFYEEEVRNHALKLPLAIDKILEKSCSKIEEIDAIGVVVGPGSFTGLRVGISTALALKIALEIPIYSFSSLYCLSKFSKGEGKGASFIDARKGEYYYQEFKKINEELTSIGKIQTLKYEQLKNFVVNLDWAIVLKGGAKIEGKFPSKVEFHTNLNLAKIASKEALKKLKERIEGDSQVVPLYVREADAVIQM